MSLDIPQFKILLQDSTRIPLSKGFSNSVKIIVNSNSQEISPSFELSFSLSSRNHHHIVELLGDQFVCCRPLCNHLASLISMAAYELGFGFNGFTMTWDVTLTYPITVSTLLLEGRINEEELKSLETDPCSICLENLSGPNLDVTRMSCSHLFHHHCLSEWLQRKNTCPLCRTVLYE